MAVSLRSGQYGSYYGNDYYSSNALTYAQMQVNATYIYKYLSAKGWTINAIAGILGNMEHESTINPGRWESNDVGNGPGYSLVQWTPYTNYTNWCSSMGYSDPSEMDNALRRIIYELENHLQYYSTSGYPESFSEFTKSNNSPYYLACCFAWNYERSWVVLYGSESEKEALRQKRGSSANYWYEYLSGETPPIDPDEPVNPDTPGIIFKRSKYKFILFDRRKRIMRNG